MKERLDRNKPRLTEAEDRRIWQAIVDERVRRGRKARRRYRVPALAGSAALALLLVVAYLGRTPADRAAIEKMAERRVERIEEPKAGRELEQPELARPADAPRETTSPAGEAKKAPRETTSPAAEGKTTPAAPEKKAAPDGISAPAEKRNEQSAAEPVPAEMSTSTSAASSEIESQEQLPAVEQTEPDAEVGEEEFKVRAINTVKDALSKQPDVTIDSEGRLHVRGGGQSEVHYFVDGIPTTAPPAGAKGAPESAGREKHDASEETKTEYKIDKLLGSLTPLGSVGKDAPAESAPRAGGESERWPISVGGNAPVNGQAFDAMFFEHYGVNPFIDPEEDRFGTFAIDVDNASYTMTRSYLERGALPPKEAVRVEEFVNAFRHDYAPPREGAFAVHLDAAPSPFGEGYILLRAGIKGRVIDPRDRKPAVLTFVIDVSGSMRREDRLELVKWALYDLLGEMDERDEVGIVVYGSDARTVLDPTSLRDRDRIERAIASLRPEGATNAEAGLAEGYRMAGRAFRRGAINRVILCSDGVANVGETGADAILARVAEEADRGIELTAIGFGMGNYNDVLLEKLADRGDGNYYYVDEMEEARRVFTLNLTGTLQTIAKEVKIQVEFEPGTVRRYRLIGYENRDVRDEDFRNDAVDAGEIGAGHEVTALFEIKLEKEPEGKTLATVRLRHEDPESGRVTEESSAIRIADVARSIDAAEPSFRLDAAVAEFAEILRKSYWARGGDLDAVRRLARSAARDLRDSSQADELIRLVERADRLVAEEDEPPPDDDYRPSWEKEER